MKTLQPNLILESITKIHENKEKLMRQPNLLIELQSNIEQVSQFLDLDTKFATLLSVMICEQLMGEAVPMKKIMNHSHNNSISHIRFHLKMSLRCAQGLNKTHIDLYMKRWLIWAKSLLNSCIEHFIHGIGSNRAYHLHG